MTDSTKFSIGLILIAAGLFWPRIKDRINIESPKQGTTTVNVVFEKVAVPTPALQSLTANIGTLVVGEDAGVDKIRLAQFYAQLSHVVRNEPGFIQNTGQFREYNAMAGQINFAGLSLKDKYPGLGDAIDSAIATAIGLENISLDQNKRNDLANVLAAISWSLWHE
jgi:hypothetical protein